jgi:DNA (cytosine-5)-methyltransferase 1
MHQPFGIVDIFSGPGGLGEGFAALRCEDGKSAFEIDVSVEKDPVAHATLTLRAFLRKFPDGPPTEYVKFLNARKVVEPDWSKLYPAEWAKAEAECLNLTLGERGAARILRRKIEEVRERRGDRVVLIGGPPCQAYSVAGRGRKPAHRGYVPHAENRHLLYREYIDVLRQLRPAAFVMENVKGMLSSKIDGRMVLDLVVRDLRSGGGAAEYVLCPLAGECMPGGEPIPTDFLVQAEDHGIPQARHRVIIVGLRRDLVDRAEDLTMPRLPTVVRPTTVRDVLGKMPKMRSGLSARSGETDSAEAWRAAVVDAARQLAEMDADFPAGGEDQFLQLLLSLDTAKLAKSGPRKGRGGGVGFGKRCPSELQSWIGNKALRRLAQHETRSHMRTDLLRYLFASAWTHVTGVSPKSERFPSALAPDHANWTTGKYRDRFRVQHWDSPASTVTCHLSADGHYFIHPDPAQCRTLTVREAARLQTFPDDYYFRGNRTQQYVQVGNAVPPFLAHKIAGVLEPVLRSMLATEASMSAQCRLPAPPLRQEMLLSA